MRAPKNNKSDEFMGRNNTPAATRHYSFPCQLSDADGVVL